MSDSDSVVQRATHELEEIERELGESRRSTATNGLLGKTQQTDGGYTRVWQTDDTTIGVTTGADVSRVSVSVSKSPSRDHQASGRHTSRNNQFDDLTGSATKCSLNEDLNSSLHSRSGRIPTMQTDNLSTGHSKAILSALKALQEKIRRLEEEKQKYIDDYDQLSSDYARLKHQSDQEIQTLRSRYEVNEAKLKAYNTELGSERDSLKRERGTVQKEKQSLQDNVQRLRQELEKVCLKLREASDKHSETSNALSRSEANTSRLEAKVNQLETELHHAVASNKSSAEQVSELSNRVQTLASVNKSLSQTIPGSPRHTRTDLYNEQSRPRLTRKTTRTKLKKKKKIGNRSRSKPIMTHSTSRNYEKPWLSHLATDKHMDETNNISKSQTTRNRNVHEELKHLYGGKPPPFILGQHAGPTHSVLGNVQLTLGDRQSFGTRPPVIPSTRRTHHTSPARSLSTDSHHTRRRNSSSSSTNHYNQPPIGASEYAMRQVQPPTTTMHEYPVGQEQPELTTKMHEHAMRQEQPIRISEQPIKKEEAYHSSVIDPPANYTNQEHSRPITNQPTTAWNDSIHDDVEQAIQEAEYELQKSTNYTWNNRSQPNKQFPSEIQQPIKQEDQFSSTTQPVEQRKINQYDARESEYPSQTVPTQHQDSFNPATELQSDFIPMTTRSTPSFQRETENHEESFIHRISKTPQYYTSKYNDTLGGTLTTSTAAKYSADVDEVIEALEHEYNGLEHEYNKIVEDLTGVTQPDSGTLETALQASNQSMNDSLHHLVHDMREKGHQIELLRQAKNDLLNASERSPLRSPDAVRRRNAALRTLQYLRKLAAESNPWLLQRDRAESRRSRSPVRH